MSLLDSLERDGVRGDPSKGVAPIVCVRWAGDPVSKGRPRARIAKTRAGLPFVHVYTDKETRDFEAAIRAAAFDAMQGRRVLDEPLAVTIFAYLPVPKSWSAKKQDAARAGLSLETGRKDIDNIGKAVMDALNPFRDPRTKIRIPVVWTDDSLVVDCRILKIFAKRQPGVIIEIRPAGPPPQPWSET